MKSHIQFLTTPTVDTPGTALLLHFDDKRYVFGNLHEGLQRASLQFGGKIMKARDIFVTGKTGWATNGGLLGLVLTLSDGAKSAAASKAETSRLKFVRAKAFYEEKQKIGRATGPPPREPPAVLEDPTLRIHGGPNITHTVATARAFIFRNGMPLEIKEYDHVSQGSGEDNYLQPTWTDKHIQVWAMPLRPNSTISSQPELSKKGSAEDYKHGRNEGLKERPEPRKTQSGLSSAKAQSDHEFRENVVKEMFQSRWQLDRLVETPLHRVKMPAQIFIRDAESKKYQKYDGPLPDGNTSVPNINVFVREPWPAALIGSLPPTRPSPIAMSYIIRNHQQRGKFRPDAAKRLKVPAGPLWAQLTRGKKVLSSDGTTVTSEMVLEPGTIGGGVAVVDLPSSEYVLDAINRPEWRADRITEGIGAIVWLLGPGVIKNETLINFMKALPQIEHVVSSSDTCPNYLAMSSAASGAVRLNKIDSIRYPDLLYSNHVPIELNRAMSDLGAPVNLHTAQRGLKFQMEPKMELQLDDIREMVDPASIASEIPQPVLQLAKTAQDDIASEPAHVKTAKQNLPGPEAEIICLGTGSALPSNHRNVSSTLLRVPGCGSYLFDCGENTLGQLKRIYKSSELAEILQDLKIIWISHLHADHHLGTASVIKAWYNEVHGGKASNIPNPSVIEPDSNLADWLSGRKRLFLVGHSKMMRWLKEYSSAEDFGYDHIMPLETWIWQAGVDRNCTKLIWNEIDFGLNTAKSSPLKHAMTKATGLSNLVACFVSHCYGAQAVSLTFPTGFKVSYSGDCRPSNNFIKIGSGSTVLIHEATFDDEMQNDASAKKHSTTSEAIGVGVAMGAKRIILTHFSQRYAKIPTMSDLDKLTGRLEDTEDVDDDIEAVDFDGPIAVEPETHAPINNLLGKLDTDEDTAKSMTAENSAMGKTFDDAVKSAERVSGSRSTTSPRNDIKIAVAFDYMRVRVKDIAHLERFTPALQELYAIEEPDPRPSHSRPGSRLSGTESTQPNSSKKGQKSKGRPKHEEIETEKKGVENEHHQNRQKSNSLKRKSQMAD